jgi:hypothetical protein
MAVAFPYINDPKYWRERSEEARSIAKLLDDPEAKRQILDIAAGYDRLSEHMKQLQKQLTSRELNAMPTADDYRRNAAECLQALKLATKDEVRSALITMAQRWNELADHQEREQARLSGQPGHELPGKRGPSD